VGSHQHQGSGPPTLRLHLGASRTQLLYTSDKDETLKYLEAAYREHNPSLINLQYEAIVDFLHDDPRYQALVKKLALPAAH
jgi:hypothetical protein